MARKTVSAKKAPKTKTLVVADVILRSQSGRTVVDAKQMSPKNVREFLPAAATLERAKSALRAMGFEITFGGPVHLTIAGPQDLFEHIFSISLKTAKAKFFSSQREATQTYFVSNRKPTVPDSLEELIETIEFPGPITYWAGPPLTYDHVEVPDDIARAMDARKAHQRGITGTGIQVALVDSGFMNPLHSYYAGLGYTIAATVSDPLDPTPGDDSAVGHGTGIGACALAVAPGCSFMPFKIYPSLGGASASAAMGRAVAAGAQVISCSWGVGFSAALQMTINNAVAAGIVVCVAAGNGGPVGWPSSEPAVISVGGAFLGPDDGIVASSYASSGTNVNNPGRQCPDVCGIVGMAPKGIFIELPTQPGSALDAAFAGSPYPNFDTTTASDGWLVASGTSSATPMVAGVAALILQANPGFTPAQVRAALVNSCVDVTSGSSASGQPATAGNDLATGAGLVQAYRALRDTDIWLKDNDTSDIGLVPTIGRRPAWPPHATWTSPDIRVFDPDPGPASFDSAPFTNPVFGQDNFVYVRVRNRGTQPTGPVTVALYYADPATSLTFPGDWKDGQSGIPAEGSITVGSILTNMQTVGTIPANGQVVVPTPFVLQPPDPSAATETQVLSDGRIWGHYCLLVRTASADDPIIVPSGWISVVDDNNIGMRNVHVYSAPPGHDFFFTFSVGRPKKLDEQLHEIAFDLSRLPVKTAILLETKKGKLNGRWTNAKQTSNGVRMNAGKEIPRLRGLELRAGERVTLRVGIKTDSGMKPGDYPLDVMQFAGKRTLGGVRFILRVEKI